MGEPDAASPNASALSAFVQAEEELAASNAALREARGQAELLTRLVVHDLRSPLTTVVSGLDVALQAWSKVPSPDPDVEETLAIARVEAWRLVDMISDLLAVGKLEQGLRAQRAPIDVGALLGEVAAAHEAHGGRIALAERAGWSVSFELELPDAEPAAAVAR